MTTKQRNKELNVLVAVYPNMSLAQAGYLMFHACGPDLQTAAEAVRYVEERRAGGHQAFGVECGNHVRFESLGYDVAPGYFVTDPSLLNRPNTMMCIA